MDEIERELALLTSRVVELEQEVTALRARTDRLDQLADRVVHFLRVTHGADAPSFEAVERALEEAFSARS